MEDIIFSSEIVLHLIIDVIVTSVVLYFVIKHIRKTEIFYDESREEWNRQKEIDKKLEQKLNDYLVKIALQNKQKILSSSHNTPSKNSKDKTDEENQDLLTHYLANISQSDR